MQKRPESKSEIQQRLLDLGSNSSVYHNFSDEKILLKNALHFNVNNDPFEYDLHTISKPTPSQGLPKSSDPTLDTLKRRQARRKCNRIENKSDFITCAENRFRNIRESCEKYNRSVVSQFQESKIDFDHHHEKALIWINKSNLGEHQPEMLFHFCQLLPSLINPIEMKEIAKLHVARLKKILRAIDTLNVEGVLSENLSIADRSIWMEVSRSVAIKIRYIKTIGKFLGFQPKLIHFSKYMVETKLINKNQIVYRLLDDYDILEDLYKELIKEHKVLPMRKKKILNRLSDEISKMSKESALSTVLKYR